MDNPRPIIVVDPEPDHGEPYFGPDLPNLIERFRNENSRGRKIEVLWKGEIPKALYVFHKWRVERAGCR